jgi:hypothetical protein
MAKLHSKTRKYLAVIVDDRGRTKKRRFPKRRLAAEWLEISAPSLIEGRIERVEVYTHRGVLVWSKSFPN